MSPGLFSNPGPDCATLKLSRAGIHFPALLTAALHWPAQARSDIGKDPLRIISCSGTDPGTSAESDAMAEAMLSGWSSSRDSFPHFKQLNAFH